MNGSPVPAEGAAGAQARSKRRILELDVLRFVAVVLVMGRHMTPCPEAESGWLATVTETWQRGGWIGVDLFFVLSGFLVSGLLFHEYARRGAVDVKRFLIRRGLKIYPAFWAFIAFTIVVRLVIHRDGALHGLAGELLFLQNYLPRMWNHTWSLAVEEHFYVFLALVVVLLVRRAHRRGTDQRAFASMPVVFALVALVTLALRLLTAHLVPRWDQDVHMFPTHLRIDSLQFGVLLSWLWTTKGRLRLRGTASRALVLLAGTALLAPPFAVSIATPWMSVWGVMLLWLGSGAVLISLMNARVPDNVVTRFAGRLGAHSYSIYLWHMVAERWMTREVLTLLPDAWAGSWPVYAGVYFVLTFAVGTAMSRLVEVPVLRLRDRLFPSSVGAVSRAEPEAAPAGGGTNSR